MHLKRLILHGFKSFADPTSISFEGHQITGIVGPNGCGKSNVVDAVKWILGEQRPTGLRGKEMLDVIFNGTVRRPPMGLCEGSLVFDNRNHTLALDEEEVTVTRRVFRSGEADYLINGRPSRLKDVRDLFAGTGLGPGGYAFMEQGQIDRILDSNPLERRRIFEEAAGISRFRTRQRETEGKLKRVEENLTRLQDIVEEVERQIRSLKLHAGKARSHRDMTARIRALQTRLNRHRYLELTHERDELAGRFGELERERTRLEKERLAQRQQVRAVDQELQRLMEALSLARTKQAEISGQVEILREKIRHHRDYGDELAERRQKRDREGGLLDERLARLRQDVVVNKRESCEVKRDAERLAELAGRQEKQVLIHESRALELRTALEDLEEDLASQERELRELAREEARLEAHLTHLEARMEGVQGRLNSLEEERVQRKHSLAECTGKQQAHTSILEEQRAVLTEEELRVDALEQEFIALSDEAALKEAEASRAAGRLEVLKGTLERRESLDEGTRALLLEQEENPSFLPGLRGLLVDLFEVELEHARGVETALGELASALVVDRLEDVLVALDFLSHKGLGGARFLPLDRFPKTGEPGLPGLRMLHKGAGGVVTALLAGIQVVDGASLRELLEHPRSLGPLVVTSDGTVIRNGCIISVPPADRPSRGLVVLQAEARDLEQRLPQVEAAMGAAREKVAVRRRERDASREKVKQLSVELLKQEGQAARLDQEVVRLVTELERMEGERDRLHEEQVKLRQEKDRQEEQLRQSQLCQNTVQARRDRVQREQECCRENLRDEQTVLAEVASEVGKLRVAHGRLLERQGGLSRLAAEMEEGIKTSAARLQELTAEKEALERNQEDTAAALEQEEGELQAILKAAQEGQGTVQAREVAAAKVRARMQDQVSSLEALEEEFDRLQDHLARSRGREGELKASLASLQERTLEELDLDLESLASLPPEEEEDQPDWRQVEGLVRELRNKIARLGHVNLAACEELKEAQERAAFLFRERADVESSREQLRRILKDIEVRSSALFLTTFQAVQEHFSGIFRTLFGGGRARLLIEDPDHPLESGIEIKARPSGKEQRSIRLLSGGERTMTAVALLFAIFKANPAPCAFLDEVDAALDEDNTERFGALLEEFAKTSQFVIVSHSRRTMQRTGRLIGIAMPEKGVSRPVLVDLEEVSGDGEIRGLSQKARGTGNPPLERRRHAPEGAGRGLTPEANEPGKSRSGSRGASMEAVQEG